MDMENYKSILIEDFTKLWLNIIINKKDTITISPHHIILNINNSATILDFIPETIETENCSIKFQLFYDEKKKKYQLLMSFIKTFGSTLVEIYGTKICNGSLRTKIKDIAYSFLLK